MFVTIKGIYENGVIKPLENVTVEENTEVIITFLKPQDRNFDSFSSSAGSWRNVDTNTLKKRIKKNRTISKRKLVIL